MDLKLIQDNFGRFDLGIGDNGDFQTVEGFDTSIQTSLFSDARASETEVAIPQARRGWLGDLSSPVENRLYGCLLWLSDQSRLTQDTLNDTIDRARKGLNWFVEDGIAKSLIVDGVIVPRSGIQLEIIITSFSGAVETHYVPLWELTGVN